MDTKKISVCILVKNAQNTLAQCLESLREFGEIVLLDNNSTDKTLQIAQEFNTAYKNLRIEKSEFIGFGALKNLCVSYAKNEWILSIDSDEVLENEALSEIKALDLKQNFVVALGRKNLYDGEWIKACGWYPDFVWRIFNKNFTGFNDNFVHESVKIPQNAEKIYLKNALKHYAYDGIEALLDKLQRYSTLYAQRNLDKSSSMGKALLRSFWSFLRNYFFKKGFLYGYKGFMISVCNALGVFFKYAKLYELKYAKPNSVSLIITTYNQKERLALVLDSVKCLNSLPNEVLVADDGSTNDTKEMIETYKKDFPCPLKHIWHEDKGFRLSHIRNLAVKAAKSEYIIIIDGDMILASDFISDHLSYARHKVFLQGSRVILDETRSKELLAKSGGGSLKKRKIPLLTWLIYRTSRLNAKIFDKKELIKGIRGCNMSFFKCDCEAINGFNEEFVGWGREDSEFVARFLFNGGELRRLKFSALAYHIYHDENSRQMFEKNHQIYLNTIKNKSKWAKMGIKSNAKV